MSAQPAGESAVNSDRFQAARERTRPRVICLVGPTGTGKTRAAITVAREFGGQIVNCDSRQVYRDFPLITAQPSPEERSQCPHWLYGFLECWEKIDAAMFADKAREAMEQIRGDEEIPVLVGGTGLYLKSILFGLAQIPTIPGEIRSRVCRDYERLGPERMHAWLQTVDPPAGSRIHARDRQRVTRALEVFLATGRPISEWQERSRRAEPCFDACLIGLWSELDNLTPRLESRIEAMLAGQALQEVDRAWKRCPDEAAPGWSGIGCMELLQAHLGRVSLAEARALWLKNTRSYAKRQLTWFKKLEGVAWVKPGDDDALKQRVARWLEQGPGRIGAEQ